MSLTVSHALRHEPWVHELELDDAGWGPVDALRVRAGDAHGSGVLFYRGNNLVWLADAIAPEFVK